MNYAPCLSTACCLHCGDAHSAESLTDAGHCPTCAEDAATAKAKEDAADFAFMARDWFTRDLRIKTLAECFDAREAMRVAS